MWLWIVMSILFTILPVLLALVVIIYLERGHFCNTMENRDDREHP